MEATRRETLGLVGGAAAAAALDQRPPNLDVTDAQKAAIRKGLAQITEMG